MQLVANGAGLQNGWGVFDYDGSFAPADCP